MLIDEAEIILEAGHGGKGKVSFYVGNLRGPDGGNGGKGGDIYIQPTTDITALKSLTYKKIIKAESGEAGGSNCKSGKDGKDLTIELPIGSLIKDVNSSYSLELTDSQKISFCKGGLGGKGNFEFKSPRNTTPQYAQPGLPGETKTVKITLKLIADFGIIGLPNSGKSSLLNELTAANAKTADYPFTTLEPNLGVFNGKVLADIPGLIEGASLGKGLGLKFLKHIEKTAVLLHCIASDSKNYYQNYQTILSELKNYDPSLIKKKQIILITKSDLEDKNTLQKKIKNIKAKIKPQTILPVSIYNFYSIEKLKQKLKKSRHPLQRV